MFERLREKAASSIVILFVAACSSDPSGDAAQTDGGGDANTACSACAVDERCIDGACVGVPVAVVSLATTTNRGGTPPDVTLENQVCFYAPHVLGEAIGRQIMTQGSCVVYEVENSVKKTKTRGDIGVVNVKGGHARPSTLTADPVAECYQSSSSDNALPFLDGDTLSISGSGGKDFPAFSTSLTAPGKLEVPQILIERDKDLRVLWSGTPLPAGETVDVTVVSKGQNKTVTVACKAPDTGPFTIPRAVMAQLLEGAENQLEVMRERRTRIEPTEKVIVLVRLATLDVRASGQ